MKHLSLRGVPMPALGLGTWKLTGPECTRTVARALALGYRSVDTAQGYENEAEIGEALIRSGVSREDLFITTKAWPDDLVEDPECARASCDRLRVDHADLFLMHWPSPRLPLEQTLDALVSIRDRGLARFVGVSNFPPGMLESAIRRAPIVCNQVEYHPYLGQTHLLGVARRHGVIVTAYSPLAHGKVAHDETLTRIGRGHGKTPAQVALRWLLQQDHVAVVPKAGSPEHLRDNIEVFDFSLSDAEMREVDALARGERLIDPDFAPDWSA